MFLEINYRSEKDDTFGAGAEQLTGVGSELGNIYTEMIADYSYPCMLKTRGFLPRHCHRSVADCLISQGKSILKVLL